MREFGQQARRIGRRWRGRLVFAAVLVLVVLGLWRLATRQVGVRRAAPRIATITPLPPPPPPPKQKPEPKQEPRPQEIPRPNQPVPKPVATPRQAPSTAKQVTINAPAQAGNDSFNIGAGSGGGMVGSGGGNGLGGSSYQQYLGYALQQAIRHDERTQRLVFDIRVDLWIGADGVINRVELVASSGSKAIDGALEDVLRGLRIDTSPPPGLDMPMHVAIHGRRPG